MIVAIVFVIISVLIFTLMMIGIGVWIGLEIAKRAMEPKERTLHFAYQCDDDKWELFTLIIEPEGIKLLINNIKKMWRPRVFGKALSHDEMMTIINHELDMFNLSIPKDKKLPYTLELKFDD